MTIDPYALGHIRVGLFLYGGIAVLTFGLLGGFLIRDNREFGYDQRVNCIVSGVLLIVLAIATFIGMFWLIGLATPGGTA